MRASIVSCSDSSPVLKFSEHIFYFVTFPVEFLVVEYLLLTVFLWRYAGDDAFFFEGLPEPVSIVSPVCQHHPGIRQESKQLSCSLIITHLSCGQKKQHGFTIIIDYSMEFGVQAAFSPADSAGNSPFLSRLAAVRCAFR